MTNLIDKIEKMQEKESIPSFQVGDLVKIGQTIVEGKKERVQFFEGTVIKIQNASIRRKVTLRKVVDGVGVEKTYMVHSPLVNSLVVIRKGKVRRARLHYLRDRVGSKATRIKERK